MIFTTIFEFAVAIVAAWMFLSIAFLVLKACAKVFLFLGGIAIAVMGCVILAALLFSIF